MKVHERRTTKVAARSMLLSLAEFVRGQQGLAHWQTSQQTTPLDVVQNAEGKGPEGRSSSMTSMASRLGRLAGGRAESKQQGQQSKSLS